MRYQRDEVPSEFLREVGIDFKVQGNQLNATCPICNKVRHFYMHPTTGQWDCKKCGEKGNIRSLRTRMNMERDVAHVTARAVDLTKTTPVAKEQIDKEVKALYYDKEVMQWLTKDRHFDKHIIATMRLGVDVKMGARWVGYPWLRRGGKDKGVQCWGVKYRLFPPDADKLKKFLGGERKPFRFRRLAGYKSILYNEDVARGEPKNLIIASGESDAIALMSANFTSVGIVATTTGESAMPDDMLALLRSVSGRVYIVYDNDAVGLVSGKKLAKRIGIDKCYHVRWPEGVKDAAEFLGVCIAEKRDVAASFKDAFAKAYRAEVPTMTSIAAEFRSMNDWEFLQRADEQVAVERTSHTPWDELNARLPAMSGLVVLSAPQGTGKTTFGLNIADHWATNGRPALFYCLEMTRKELAVKVAMATFRIDLEEFRRERERRLQAAALLYENVPLYLGYSATLRTPADVMDLLRMAVIRFELQMVVFDNIHIIGRNRDRRDEIGQFTLELKRMATELDVTVIAIAQPRKLERGAIMTPWDLKDSVDIFSDADQVLILHRKTVGIATEKQMGKAADAWEDQATVNDEILYEPKTLVRIAKARFGKPGDAWVILDGPCHRFVSLGDERVNSSSTWKTYDDAKAKAAGDT